VGLSRIAVPQQQMQLMRVQAQGSTGAGFGPPREAALRKPLLQNPKALAVVGQTLDGVPTTRTEYEERTGLRVVTQCLTTERGQAINAFTEVDRLDGQQDPHLRRDLDHPRLQNAWAIPMTVDGSQGRSTVIVAPAGSDSSMRHTAAAWGNHSRGRSSTKDGVAMGAEGAEA
jgi:hypothetical protein